MAPRFLLLQARLKDDPMAAHEHECFVARTGLPAENIVCYNICEDVPTMETLKKFDALTVGGAGDFSVAKRNLATLPRVLDVLREVVSTGFPTFASCFGYQCMVDALGGEIIHDPENTEVGTYEIVLTEEGTADPLFGILPARLLAEMGHQDRATRHPDGLRNLASSERSAFQAFRVPDQPVWATQFHPELGRQSNLDRYLHYLENYSGLTTPEEQRKTIARFRESPETGALLPRFLKMVFDWPR